MPWRPPERGRAAGRLVGRCPFDILECGELPLEQLTQIIGRGVVCSGFELRLERRQVRQGELHVFAVHQGLARERACEEQRRQQRRGREERRAAQEVSEDHHDGIAPRVPAYRHAILPGAGVPAMVAHEINPLTQLG